MPVLIGPPKRPPKDTKIRSIPATIPDHGDLAGSPISGLATIPDRDESTQSPTSGQATIPDCDNQIRIPEIDLDADETISKQIEGGKKHAQGNAARNKQTSRSQDWTRQRKLPLKRRPSWGRRKS